MLTQGGQAMMDETSGCIQNRHGRGPFPPEEDRRELSHKPARLDVA